MTEQIYTNYRLQLPGGEVLGTLVVEDGRIRDIQPGVVSEGQDGGGDYLLPGLVELHTDNLEQCIAPRPKVNWPLDAAAVYHDRDLASAGITTVCDAVSVGDLTPNSLRMQLFEPMLEALERGQDGGRFVVDHRLHLRCELGYEHTVEVVEQYVDHPMLCLLSLMDHTPGQRQFTKMEKYREYYMGKHGVTADEMEQLIAERIADQQQHAQRNRKDLVQIARDRSLALASHDDATVEHVEESVADGVVVAEFPTTVEAAKASRHHGLQILMGAPNLVLGGSHSGNVSAMELVSLDLVDIISSDYVPQSLLQAMFLIMRTQLWPLHRAAELFTLKPAKAVGLDGDRGSLEVGKRADLLMVHDDGIVPRILEVVGAGRRIA